jgi:hypothetical protein
MNDIAQKQSAISIFGVGWTVSLFFVVTYVLCIASGAIWPDWEMHRPWLQFFPGFEWLTLKGFLIGLVESFLYGWYVAVVFVPLYNVFVARS